MFLVRIAIPTLLLFVTACNLQPDYEINYLHSRPGTVTAVKSEDTVIFYVNNESGIGKANIVLLKGN